MYLTPICPQIPVKTQFVNAIGGPLLALMALAMFARRVNANGMFWGGIAGLLLSILFAFLVKPLALHYYAAANFLLTAASCFLFSACSKPGNPARE